jgi:hypothetical protein
VFLSISECHQEDYSSGQLFQSSSQSEFCPSIFQPVLLEIYHGWKAKHEREKEKVEGGEGEKQVIGRGEMEGK